MHDFLSSLSLNSYHGLALKGQFETGLSQSMPRNVSLTTLWTYTASSD
jgi:hypothetical protein